MLAIALGVSPNKCCKLSQTKSNSAASDANSRPEAVLRSAAPASIFLPQTFLSIIAQAIALLSGGTERDRPSVAALVYLLKECQSHNQADFLDF